MQITSGKIQSAQKVLVYGPEGIGKSTFASKFPNPVFCDTEGSTKHLDVRRTPKPQSWTELLEQVRYFIQRPGELGTFVLDTADWAERLCIDQLCATAKKAGIEDFGYGKGYVYLAEEFGRLLNLLEELIDRGVHVVLTAHAWMRKFEQPDEMGSYDRWETKLGKKTSPLVKEWVDMVLFANYKTYVTNVDGQGAEKGKNKAQGSKRVMYTTHHACWDAKNRHGLPDEMPFDWARIAHLFTTAAPAAAPAVSTVAGFPATPAPPLAPATVAEKPQVPTPAPEPPTLFDALDPHKQSDLPAPQAPQDAFEGVPERVAVLMREANVTPKEVAYVVFQRGHFPASTPFANYPSDFIDGWMLPVWPKIVETIQKNRDEMPF